MAIACSTILLPGYRLVETLHQTAKTLVYRAVEESSAAHPVVIKIHPTAADPEQQRLQLRHQYTISRSLKLPGVVCPERLEPYESGDALVMPDWGGVALPVWMQHQSASPDQWTTANRVLEVLTIGLQLNDIVHELHQNYVIHQTIRPAHILIHPTSKQIKLIDFSRAVQLSTDLQILRHPPELLAQGGDCPSTGNFQPDFFGVGATLWELLTGQSLSSLDSQSIQTRITKILAPIGGDQTELTAQLVTVFNKLIGPEITDRYQSSYWLQRDLAACQTQYQQLLAQSPAVTAPPLDRLPLLHLNRLDTAAALAIHEDEIAATVFNLAMTAVPDPAADFVSILQVCQTLAGAIPQPDMWARFTQLMVQQAEADRGVLVLPNYAADSGWQVAVTATPKSTHLCAEPLEEQVNLPIRLIQHAQRTQAIVLLDDAQTEPPVEDPYLHPQPAKSLLCLPIFNQQQILAVVYLECQSSGWVFTRERLLLLNYLGAQVAIGLSTAKLHPPTHYQQPLTTLLSKLPGMVYAYEPEGMIKFVSQGCLGLTGYAPADLISQPCKTYAALIHPDDYERVKQAVGTALANQTSFQISYRMIPQQGSEKWVCDQGQGYFDAAGKLLVEGFMTDISDRKQAEMALQAKLQLLALRSVIDSTLTHSKTLPETLQCCVQELVDHLDVAFARIWTLNELTQTLELQASAGLYTHIDGPHARVPVGKFKIGLIAQERMSHLTNDVLNDPRVGDKAWAAQEGMVAFAGYPLMVSDRLVGVLAMFARQPLPSSVLDTLGFVADEIALGIDRHQTEACLRASEANLMHKAAALEAVLTELKTTQLQMLENEKMAALGNLIAGIAHEINNPIGFLSGSLSNLNDYVRDLLGHLSLYQQQETQGAVIQAHAEAIEIEFLTEDLPKVLASMHKAIQRIKGISKSLRSFSRADTDQRTSVDLHEGLESTLLILKYRLKADQYRPEIQVIQDYGALPLVECFPSQLNQVFMNILANAIDVFDEAAQQSSFCDLTANPQCITIQTTWQAESSSVTIIIRDNGCGMPAAVKERIFDHLFTTKGVDKGTGLGLAIAHQIVVEKHGGTITVESAPGEGTEFTIQLPIRPA